MSKYALALASFLLVASGCKEQSNFAGSGSKAPAATSEKPQSDDATPAKTSTKGSAADPSTGTDTELGTTDSTAPTTAVTAGSFKAWADPASPAEGQDYTIYIEVTLKSNFAGSYAKEDLSGVLTGTDGYQQAIEKSFAPIPAPFPFIPPFDPRGNFVVNGKLARISFMVPGAEQKVKDTIQIHSNALNESQTVSLVFQ